MTGSKQDLALLGIIISNWRNITEQAICFEDNHNIQLLRNCEFYVLLAKHLDIFIQRKTNLMNNLFSVYFVKHSTYFGRIYSPSSGGTPYGYNNWYLLFFLTNPEQQAVI